jgi:hypothetical protein
VKMEHMDTWREPRGKGPAAGTQMQAGAREWKQKVCDLSVSAQPGTTGAAAVRA